MSMRVKQILNSFYVVLVVSVFLLIVACEKETTVLSKKSILVSHNWAWSTFKHNGIETSLQDCEKDDYYLFSSNGTYQFIATRVKCSKLTSDKRSTWSLSSDEKTLTIDVSANYTVEITESQLKLLSTVGDYEFTYVAF
jgi:hypothetical protein